MYKRQESDKAVLRRAADPRDALAQLDAIYKPTNNSTTQNLWDKFNNMRVRTDENPVEALHKLEAINANLNENDGCGLDDYLVLLRLVDALPAEYEMSKQHLKTLPVRMTRNDVVRVISSRFADLKSERERVWKGPKAGGVGVAYAWGAKTRAMEGRRVVRKAAVVRRTGRTSGAVSYTHLTLPTKA